MSKAIYHGRRKPYTEIGIRRMPCARCGVISSEQWNASLCANNRRKVWKPLCRDCDIELNRMVLEFLNFPNAKELIEKYRREKQKIL